MLRRHFFALAAAAFLGLFLLWPLTEVAWGTFCLPMPEGKTVFTLTYLAELLYNPLEADALWRSAWIAVATVVVSTALALPAAWLLARRNFWGKEIMAGLLLVPLIMPPFVGAVGMRMFFARFGPLTQILNNLGLTRGAVDWLGNFPLAGVVFMQSLHLFPILYLNLTAAFANIDPTLEEAASNLGCRPARVFWRVTLPLAAPGLFAGMTLVFIWAFTELGTPLVFGVRNVLPVRIYDNVSEIGTNPLGYAQVFLLLAITAIGFWASKAFTSRSRDVATLGRLSASAKEKGLSAAGAILAWLGYGAVVFIGLFPHLSVVLLSLARRWQESILPQEWTLAFYRRALRDELAAAGLQNSLILAFCATFLDVILGFGIAWICVRGRLRGGWLLDGIAMLPLAVPGLVLAFGYLGAFGGISRPMSEWLTAQAGALGLGGENAVAAARWVAALCDPRVNPMALLAISYAVRRLPYMVRAAHAGLEQVSRVYEEAAANLGAKPRRVLQRITLPLLMANLLAGSILCFTFAMLEVSDSLILAQTEAYYPLTKAIYALIDGLEHGMNVAAALGVWAMTLLAMALLWTSALLGRKLGQMFKSG